MLNNNMQSPIHSVTPKKSVKAKYYVRNFNNNNSNNSSMNNNKIVTTINTNVAINSAPLRKAMINEFPDVSPTSSGSNTPRKLKFQKGSPTPCKKKLFSPKYNNNNHINNNLKDSNADEDKEMQDLFFDGNNNNSNSNNNISWLESSKRIKELLYKSVEEEKDGFLFMKYCPNIPNSFFDKYPYCLPKKKSSSKFSHTLILDLDETLVHCTIEESLNPDLIFPVVFNGENYKVYMKKRPYFINFLQQVSKLFEVVVFTASQRCYAEKLLNMIDPNKKLIKYRLYRENCVQVEGNFVKDLRVLGRDLSKTIIIDNSPPAFSYQIDNGIPIVSWFDDKNDKELFHMIPLLKKLTTLNDIRPFIRKNIQLRKLLKNLQH